MAKKERPPLFITKLVDAQWESGAIKVEFNAGSEEVHAGFLSKPYAKELAMALLRLLADKESEPTPPFDDLKLEEIGDNIRFTLLKGGVPVLTGNVTKGVAKYANKWLTRFFDGPNVVRPEALRKRNG